MEMPFLRQIENLDVNLVSRLMKDTNKSTKLKHRAKRKLFQNWIHKKFTLNADERSYNFFIQQNNVLLF